jgi:hypothetical protein
MVAGLGGLYYVMDYAAGISVPGEGLNHLFVETRQLARLL